jgi:glycosyltransferase involved in cell wall biosynthesis
MSKNALIISPFFVPMNVVGAKRSLHFARYLPDHGWTPCVAALDASIQADAALERLVPDVPLCRILQGSETYYPGKRVGQSTRESVLKRAGKAITNLDAVRELKGRFSWRDRYSRNAYFAMPGILRFARQHGCEVVYANSGPPSAMLIAWRAARLLKKPLVVDLRDPWSIEPNYRASWTESGRRAVDALEGRIFKRSARIILNTQSARDAYRLTYHRRIEAERFTFIRNQFDPPLYGTPGPAPGPKDPFRIVYYGHLRPSKNAQLFLAALERLIEAESLTPADLEVITLGEWTETDAQAMTDRGLTAFVQRHGWLSFPDSPSLLGTASILLDLMGPNHRMQISGKFYDYLAAGRPVLSISPNVELDRMYAQIGAGERLPLDEDAVVKALQDRLARHRAGTLHGPKASNLVPFHATTATAQLARIFDEVSA